MNHSGLVAPPFRGCLYGTVADLPAYSWMSDCNTAPTGEIPVPAAAAVAAAEVVVVPSSSLADFIVGNTAVAKESTADAETSGAAAFDTGTPKAGAAFVNRYGIRCGSASGATTSQYLVDSVELSFRYRAAPVNASGNNTPAVLKVSLVNADTRPVVVVGTATLGNYTDPSGYSQQVRIQGKGLQASCDAGIGNNPRGRLMVSFAVVNNDRPVHIPLDDLAGGFQIKVGWVAAPPLELSIVSPTR